MTATRGFTLIELLIALSIVAVLSTIALPMTEVAVQRTKEQELRNALRSIRSGIDAYRQAVDEGRITKTVDSTGYPETLALLVNGVTDLKNPNGAKIFFMRRIPRDPFFRDASVPASDTWGKRAYASPPEDPREGSDVYDVYSLAGGVGLNGIPYREW